jgi:hypothetical protein
MDFKKKADYAVQCFVMGSGAIYSSMEFCSKKPKRERIRFGFECAVFLIPPNPA